MSSFSKLIRKHSCLIISVLAIFVIILSLQNAGIMPENYTNINSNSSDPTIALFSASWCGHCKNLIPHWNKFENKYNNKDNILIVNIDSDNNKDLVKKHSVKGFPTIKFCPQGLNNADGTITYEGTRNFPGLVEFLEQCKENLEGFTTEHLEEHLENDIENEDFKAYSTEDFYNY